tara:strand:+ start:1138 stop:1323 length:186 start_codon:yes stop_codon:yes gene_type:complete
MKVKLKDSNTSLPNCWKECGCSFEDWQKLQEGEEIDVKSISIGVEHLVKSTSSSNKKKGDK